MDVGETRIRVEVFDLAMGPLATVEHALASVRPDPAAVVVQVLEGDSAIAKYREVMGATDPGKAAPNTIRKVHAKSIGENSVHGSDAPETAAQAIAHFFSGNEIVG